MSKRKKDGRKPEIEVFRDNFDGAERVTFDGPAERVTFEPNSGENVFRASFKGASDLIEEVQLIRVIAEAAARGEKGAVDWLSDRFDGLAKLLAEVETALTEKRPSLPPPAKKPRKKN